MTSWYCNICGRIINNKSKSRHKNSKSHKPREKSSIFVKVYQSDNPGITEIISIIDK